MRNLLGFLAGLLFISAFAWATEAAAASTGTWEATSMGTTISQKQSGACPGLQYGWAPELAESEGLAGMQDAAEQCFVQSFLASEKTGTCSLSGISVTTRNQNNIWFGVSYVVDKDGGSCGGGDVRFDYVSADLPGPSCEAGTKKHTWRLFSRKEEGTGKLVITISGGETWHTGVPMPDGCLYTKKDEDQAAVAGLCEYTHDGPEGAGLYCKEVWTATGEVAPDGSESPVSNEAEPPADSEIQPNNTLRDTSESNTPPPTSTTNADGSVTETKTETVIETIDAGELVDANVSGVDLEVHDGITKSTTTTTETTTNPDGTMSVVETTVVEYSDGKIQQASIEWADGTPDGTTSVVRSRVEGRSTTTTTTNYDADGNQTSQTTTTDSTGDEGGCDPETGECDEPGGRVNFGEPGGFDAEAQAARMAAAEAELSQQISTVQAEMAAFFGTDALQGTTATLPDYSFDLPWPDADGVIRINWDLAAWAERLELLAAALFLAFVVLALWIILGD